ncbi:MAG: RNA polymerase sigma factor [Phycisphaerae bacterium]|nr:RNA polymerase sigma factor [Phycisphaerae bacterium]
MTDRPPDPESQDDARLLARFAGGDDGALGTLADRYEAYLYGLAVGMLRRVDLAHEAVQETWVRVIRAAPRFRGESAFRTWVYRILVNRCLDLRASAARRAALERGPARPAPSPAGPPDDERRALDAALESLSDAQRTVVLLCYHRGLTHAQAAEVLGIPIGTLKSRLSAALGALRGALSGADHLRTEPNP